ncbi:unnamed protein product [Protopolystoma xenopodis]|uniref:MAM domain-containing protein n=1 Tax=Protopolystoma xenopodis TaxID=117903 RepID=A0A448WZF0_9PLAT|nr:unnamed protein product [Protopolystoma xenopodis]
MYTNALEQKFLFLHTIGAPRSGGGRKREHYCSFADDWCGWINDPNSWRYRWSLVNASSFDASLRDLSAASSGKTGRKPDQETVSACFLAAQLAPQEQASSLFTWFGGDGEADSSIGQTKPISSLSRAASSSSDDSAPLQSRLWSPLIPSEIGLRCIRFYYHLALGRPKRSGLSRTAAGLALLQRQEG